MTERTFKIGDEVEVAPDSGFPTRMHGIVYVITEVPRGARGVNYKAIPKEGGRGLRGPGHSLIRHDPNAPTPVGIPYVPAPPLGAVVLVRGIRNIFPTEKFVVLGESGRPNTVKIVKLGGDDNRFYSNIPISTLAVLPPDHPVFSA